MKIAIIVPMELEAEYYRKKFHSGHKEMFGSTEFEHFSVNNNEIYLGLSGIGKVQAAMNLASLLTKVKVDLVFVTGTAGSLKQTVKKGDLVLADAFTYHDAHNTLAGDYVEGQLPQEPAQFVLKSAAKTSFEKYLAQEKVTYQKGLVVTGDSFIGSQQQKNEIIHNFPDALAVEMEGAAFAQVSEHFKQDLIVMRAISDNGDEDANESFASFAAKAGQKAAKLICNYMEEITK